MLQKAKHLTKRLSAFLLAVLVTAGTCLSGSVPVHAADGTIQYQAGSQNELPRSRAAGYLKGRSTTYNPINSTVLALVRFDRVSYTLFLDLVLLRILISLLHFHAPLL